jgi:hypothetical protein
MPITFARLQEYLDLVVAKNGGNVNSAPHRRFWSTHQTLTAQPIPRPKCNGADIYLIMYTDEARTKVDPDSSPLYIILTTAAGFCGKEQMPPGGPMITAAGYSLTLADGSTVTGDQVKRDIYDWLAANAPNN